MFGGFGASSEKDEAKGCFPAAEAMLKTASPTAKAEPRESQRSQGSTGSHGAWDQVAAGASKEGSRPL